MLYLTRRQFPDRLLDADALDAVADLWFGWYDEAQRRAPSGGEGYHRVEARLWGFPRQEADRLASLLTERCAGEGAARFEVGRPDPDTLTLGTPYEPLSAPCSLAAVLRCCDGPEFDGLPLMVRFSLEDWPGEPPAGRPLSGGTVVLCGQLEQGQLLLKGVWPAGLVPEQESIYHKACWSGEQSFLAALASCRQTGHLPGAPENLFAPRAQQENAFWLLTRFFHVHGESRLSSFLGRVGFFAALAGVSFALLFLLPWRPVIRLPGLVGAAFSLWGLGVVVCRQARQVVRCHANMNAALRRVFSGPPRFFPVDLAAEGAWPDPHALKYSREIEAAGGQHYLDISHEPAPTGRQFVRYFILPQDRTYVALLLMYGTRNHVLFPAKATLLLTTYFTSGERLTTSNSGAGYRKRLDPQVILRYFEDADDPATMIARHRKVLGRRLAEGRQAQPVMSPEEVLRRLESDHAAQAERLERHGYYPWSAAVRQTFRLVRREYCTED